MRILIACGGTGGHIFPAIALAQELKGRGFNDIVFVVDNREASREMVKSAGFDCLAFKVPKMPYGVSFEWLVFFFRLISSRLKAEPVVANINPDIAIGFGAYISGPIIQTAASMGIKTLIHEQNVTFGRANRLLFRRAEKVALSFDTPLIKKDPRCVITGNPIRRELLDGFKMLTKEEALAYFKFSDKRKTALVLGGSKGASAINKVMTDMVKILSDDEKDSIQVIHITGDKDRDGVEQAYRINRIPCWVRGFCDKMPLPYKAADLVICRAGAATISEIALFGVPALFIPYPFAGSHQDKNASLLARQGAAVVVNGNEINTDNFKQKLFSLINDKEGLKRMTENIRLFSKPDSAKRLADTVRGCLDAE